MTDMVFLSIIAGTHITFVKIFKFSKGGKNTGLTYVLYVALKLLRLTWMFTKAETKKVLKQSSSPGHGDVVDINN